MKPIVALFACLFVSCVSQPVVPDLPGARQTFIIDTNMGGPRGFYSLDQGQKWIYQARSPFPKTGERVLRVRQSRFDASNGANWGATLLAVRLVYKVRWEGTIEYNGQTKDLTIAFDLRSRVDSADRRALHPVDVKNLQITLGDLGASSELLPTTLAPPYQLLTLGDLPVTLAAIHAPLSFGPSEPGPVTLAAEIIRADLKLAVGNDGGRVVSSAQEVTGTGVVDDLVWAGAVNHVLCRVFDQLFD